MTEKKNKSGAVPLFVRLANRLIKGLLRLGFPMGPMLLLTVRGRKTGQLRTTPVGLFKVGGHRYLLSTFGEVQWVRNLRANGAARLGHGLYREAVTAIELAPEQAGPVLKDVLAPFLAVPFARRMLQTYYGVTLKSSAQGYVNAAQKHPVFMLRP